MAERSVLGPVLLGAAITGATGVCLYLLLRKEEPMREGRSSSLGQISLDVRISKENVGLVLGRQGSNLREIQSRTSTRIYFKEELETQDYRIACISGSADDVQYAEILIHQTISAQPRLESSVVNLPIHVVQPVLGRNDENIRSIEQKSRCRIQVSKSTVDDKLAVKLTLTGTKDQIEVARSIIECKVQEQEYIINKIENSKTGRPQRLKYQQPLFLKYDNEEEMEHQSSQVVQEDLRCTGSDKLTQVYVSCVAHPLRFWVQNVGPSSIELDKLTESMTGYYTNTDNQVFHSLEFASPGDIVVATFAGDSNFYRAKVVSYDQDEYDRSLSKVDLDFVDYGDSEVKVITDVFEIRPEYLKLKFQAIPCSLAYVRPLEPEVDWSEDSIAEFEKLTHCALWRPVLAKLIQENITGAGEKVAVVELFEPSVAGDRSIGQELAKMALAHYKEM